MKLTEQAQAELKALESRSGTLTPQEVVEAARDEGTALHECFTWDDGEAAERWRLEEARELIRSVRIEVHYEERTIRTVGYVRDTRREPAQAGYVATMKVRKSSVSDVMRAELGAISALIGRAIGIAQAKADALPGMAEALEGIKEQVDALAV